MKHNVQDPKPNEPSSAAVNSNITHGTQKNGNNMETTLGNQKMDTGTM